VTVTVTGTRLHASAAALTAQVISGNGEPHNDCTCNSSREDRRRRAPWIVTASIVSLLGGTQSDSR
jgi:hypothetical protein